MAKQADDEPAEDPAMTQVRAVYQQSGISLVELGRRMGYAEETARQAAWQFMKSRDPRMSMLRRFATAMGITLNGFSPTKGKRMSRKMLESELEEYGCELTPSGFREVLEEHKALTSPAWTVDELVCHPDEAQGFCDHIRTVLGAPEMPDHLILRSLMNARRSH